MRKHFQLIIGLFIGGCLGLYPSLVMSQQMSLNAVSHKIPKVPLETVSQLYNASHGDVLTETSYFDGLNRKVQQVTEQYSSSQKDLIQFAMYDSYGRESKKYLPYAILNNNGQARFAPEQEQASFYQTNSGVSQTDFPFSEYQFEASPLGRLQEEGFAGEAWQLQPNGTGHTRTYTHRTNNVFDAIARMEGPLSIDYQVSQMYPDDSLSVIEYEDEDGHKQLAFIDLFGRIIALKQKVDSNTWASTYYVYNQKGQLVHIIQPEGWAQKDQSSGQITADIFNRYVHSFVYDEKGRVQSHKQAGKDSVYYVYDILDRVILFQDGNLRAQQQWYFNKHDGLGRNIMQGIYHDSNPQSTVSLQRSIDSLQALPTHYSHENRNGLQFASLHGYSNLSFPDLVNCEVHTVRYYDDYDFDQDGTPDYIYLHDSLYFPEGTPSPQPMQQLTGVKSRVLNPSPDMPTWIHSISYYDKYGHVLQIQSDNHLGGQEVRSFAYNFEGLTSRSLIRHSSIINGSSTQHSVMYDYSYDHSNRLSEVHQRTDSQTSVLIAQYHYNDLGELIEKNLHSEDNGAHFLQSIDYQYNIRGWLTHINTINTRHQLISPHLQALSPGTSPSNLPNRPTTLIHNVRPPIPQQGSGSPTTGTGGGKGLIQQGTNPYQPGGPIVVPSDPASDEVEDLFAMEILYEQGVQELDAMPSFNGNVSGVKWQSRRDNKIRGYGYQYDMRDQLVNANYARMYRNRWTYDNHHYSIPSITYDLNGNIEYLHRKGTTGQTPTGKPTWGSMDELDYIYEGNRLISVTDRMSSLILPQEIEQFIDNSQLTGIPNNPLTHEYLYDANGNLIEDKNRGLQISYNHLNLPTLIVNAQQDSVRFYYTADGLKIRTVIAPNVGSSEQWDMASEFHYQHESLAYFTHSEGIARMNTTGTFLNQYALKDHLGNVRIQFTDANGDGKPEIVQEDHYYPFGARMAHLSYQDDPLSPNRYNGMLQARSGSQLYHTTFRTLDPVLGRWWQQDPMALYFPNRTPYNSNLNNPIRYSDPSGDCPICYPLVGAIAGGVGSFTHLSEVYGGYDKAWDALVSLESKAILHMGTGIVLGAAGGLAGGSFSSRFAGAVVGGVFGGLSQIVEQVIDDGKVSSWQSVGVHTAGGVAIGSLTHSFLGHALEARPVIGGTYYPSNSPGEVFLAFFGAGVIDYVISTPVVDKVLQYLPEDGSGPPSTTNKQAEKEGKADNQSNKSLDQIEQSNVKGQSNRGETIQHIHTERGNGGTSTVSWYIVRTTDDVYIVKENHETGTQIYTPLREYQKN